MNVFLVGFMGSGKSSLGKKLASRLSMPFIDLDDEIEKKEGKKIDEIFADKGETYFRQIEKGTLLKQHEEKNSIIALGGGACCNDESWNFIENNGLVIYLKEDSTTLFGRLREVKPGRPLVAGLSDSELRSFINKKLKERSAYYDKAHFIYEKKHSGFSFLVKQIYDYLR